MQEPPCTIVEHGLGLIQSRHPIDVSHVLSGNQQRLQVLGIVRHSPVRLLAHATIPLLRPTSFRPHRASSSPGSLEKVIPEATYLRLGVDQSALLIKLEKRPFLESSAHDGLAASQYELPRPTIFIELEPWTSLNWDAVDVQILRKSNAVEVPFHEVDVRPPRKFPTDDDMLSRKGGS